MIFLLVYLSGAVLTSFVILPRLGVSIANGDYDDVLDAQARANWRNVESPWGHVMLGAVWPLLAVLFAMSKFLSLFDGRS